MSKKILALFPGQGSQKVGMGKELYESNPIAKEYFDRANEALGFSLTDLCFNGPTEDLTATKIAQPAILTVSVICYEIFKQETGGSVIPVAAAGHSLGEYSALVASGALKFEDAVVQVNKRGTYMQEAVPVGVGSMVAVLGKEIPEIEENIAKLTSGLVEIANINAPGQIVLAGHKQALEELKTLMKGSKIMDLPVSAPFHCALMKPAEDCLRQDLSKLAISDAAFPIIANFTAESVVKAEQIRENLGSQVCGKVRWVESMQIAIKEFSPDVAVEFGFGNVLTGLLKRIHPELAKKNVDSIEAAKNVLV